MSVSGYIGKNLNAPRNLRTILSAGLNDAGNDAANKDAELKSVAVKRETDAYERVEYYDPVLRAHCRL
jgi:hypothetical protein